MAGNGTKIRGITIDLGLDTSGISNGLKDVQKSLSNTQKALRDVDKLLKLDPKNTELLSQKQGYLAKAIDDTKKKIEQEEKALKELETAGNSDKTREQQNALKRDIEATKQSLTKYEGELDETNRALDGYTDGVQEAAEGTQQFDATAQLIARQQLTQIFNKMGEAAKTLAKNAFSAAKELDTGYDTIVKKTGATGSAFEQLKSVADSVYGSMPSEMSDVGSAVGELNTRFKVSGDELEGLTRDFLQFSNISGTDVSRSISSVDKIMTAFGVDTEETGNVLGLLAKTSQETGIATDRLMTSLETNGAVFRSFDFSLEDSVSLLSQFEANGVDASGAATALKKAVQNASKEGKDAGSVLKDAGERIKNAATETEALQIATETFGAKGAIVMADAIRDGRIAFDETSKSIKDYGNVVSETYEATLSPWDKTQQTLQNLKRVGGELAGQALSALQPAIEKVAGVIKGLSDRFEKLSPRTKKVVGVIVALAAGAAVLGPKLAAVVQVINTMKIASTTAKAMQSLSGATEGATGATKGFTAALLANPIVAITAAIIAAVAAVTAITYALADASDESVQFANNAKAIADSTKENSKSLQQAADDAAAAVAQFQAQDEITNDLISTVEELSKKENKSAEDVTNLRTAIKKLNDIYPDLNLQYDEAADALSMTNEELRNNIELVQKQSRASTYAKLYAQLLEKQTQAQIDQLAIQRQQDDAIEEYGDIVQKVKNRGALNIFHMDDAKSVSTINKGFKELNTAADENTRALNSYEAEISVLTEEMEKLGYSIDPVTGEVKDLTVAEGEATAATGELGTAADQVAPRWNTLSESQKTAANDVVNAFNSMKDAVQQSIQSQIGWLDEYQKAEEVQASDLVTNLNNQIEGVKQWEENLRILSERGINEGLLQYLADMGPKGAAYVQAFINDSGDALEKANELWPEVIDIEGFANTAATELGTSVTQIAAGGAAAFGDLADAMGARGIEAGEMTGAGLVEGIQNAINSGEAANTAAQLGDDTIDGLAVDGLGEHSPSEYARTAGFYVGAGLRLGIIAGKIPVHNAAVSLGGEADMRKVMPDAQANARSVGFNISAGLAGGILNGKSLVIRAATEAAQAAITSAKQALQINSPSRVFDYIGEMTGVGFERGWQRSMKDVNATITADMSALADYRPDTLDADSVYNAIRSGAGDAQPIIYLDGRQITRGLKGLGVSFG